jgi:hypothetical protein
LRFFYNHVPEQQVSIEYSLSRKVRKLPTVLPQTDKSALFKKSRMIQCLFMRDSNCHGFPRLASQYQQKIAV